MIWIGAAIGFVFGVIVGLVVMGLAAAVGRNSRREERWRDKAAKIKGDE